MSSWMLISLLFLSLLIHEVQGIRLIMEEARPDGLDHVDEEYSNGRLVRKLMVSPISDTASTPKSDKDMKNTKTKSSKEENLSVESSSKERQPSAAETYPGILDIAGMDYSQARRKPPIHN